MSGPAVAAAPVAPERPKVPLIDRMNQAAESCIWFVTWLTFVAFLGFGVTTVAITIAWWGICWTVGGCLGEVVLFAFWLMARQMSDDSIGRDARRRPSTGQQARRFRAPEQGGGNS